MKTGIKNIFSKKNAGGLVALSVLAFILFTIFLKVSGYFEIGLMSDDYLNFISAQSSTLKQKFASSLPYYTNLHFRPLWFLSINFIIWLNDLTGAAKNNFTLFRMENLIYYYILIFLTGYLFFKITGRQALAFVLILLCLLYPNNINDICWTIGKVDLLCCIFIISSLIFTFSFLGKKSSYKLFSAVIFFCLGLFTKETAVIIPFTTIVLVYLSFGKDKVVEIKNMLAAEFILLLIYTLVRIYIIGIYPTEVVSTFQTPGILSSLSVSIRAILSMIIPYDYLTIQTNLSGHNGVFVLYLCLLTVFLVTTIFIFVRTNNFKYIIYLAVIFVISISPNLLAGYFRPQLILIPFIIFYLSLFIAVTRVSFDLKFFKIILPLLFIFFAVISYNLIKEWGYASVYSEKVIDNLNGLNLDKDKKNIILGLPARLGQTHMLEYAAGPYNYEKYGKFILQDKIYDIIYGGSLDTNSLGSQISIKQISENEYELETTGGTQYFLKPDGNPGKYIDENIVIKLSGKNSFRKFNKMYVKVLFDKANVYVLNGDNFIKLQ